MDELAHKISSCDPHSLCAPLVELVESVELVFQPQELRGAWTYDNCIAEGIDLAFKTLIVPVFYL
ncbi:MAG: hypothetical protein AAGF11_42520 [Myxococcota bacterium]